MSIFIFIAGSRVTPSPTFRLASVEVSAYPSTGPLLRYCSRFMVCLPVYRALAQVLFMVYLPIFRALSQLLFIVCVPVYRALAQVLFMVCLPVYRALA